MSLLWRIILFNPYESIIRIIVGVVSIENMDADFKNRVLNVVSRIPRGEVLTYKEVAERVGSPGAYRAVGSIMKQNYRKDIPCHRVVRSDFTLGEYNRGGENMKKRLLREDGVLVEQGKIRNIKQDNG